VVGWTTGVGLWVGLCVRLRLGDGDWLAGIVGWAAGALTVWLGLAAGLAGLDEQPAASAASRARPTSDRFRVSDMTVS